MPLPEPPADVRAQLAAVADKRNPKRAAFLPRGTDVPVTKGLHRASRREGTLITSDAAKHRLFRQSPTLTDTTMAGLLDYPESKGEAIASGLPVMVQGVTPEGAVAHESLASPAGVPAAAAKAGAIAPDVRVMTVPGALRRRLAGLLGI